MSNEERGDETGAYVASSAWEDLSGRMINGRATLQIYDEVAARTWQQQNPDGASSAKGVPEPTLSVRGTVSEPQSFVLEKQINKKDP